MIFEMKNGLESVTIYVVIHLHIHKTTIYETTTQYAQWTSQMRLAHSTQSYIGTLLRSRRVRAEVSATLRAN